ncbi:hypothetical protein DH2020_047262 [Rehmannia glutinosa]|uniref:PH domain-containing protein n=1 Tax=Rehmannia glutinosa TaxID=99300 RepID=A0ABR0UAG9_REHGL
MHPLCCITLESPGIGDGSPEPTLLRTGSAVNFSGGGSEINVGGSDVSTSTSVAGILYKWTNYGKGWRSRWFTLRNNGVLSYSKTRRPDAPPGSDVVLIGSATGSRRSGRKHSKTVGIVHLKISSFRESKSDDRRFYIFTATKTLHLRTNSRKERVAWIQALISTRGLFSLRPQNDNTPLLTRELSVSTERLKQRLLEEGIGEGLVKDCEQIMLSEFSGVQGQFQILCEERSNLLDTLRQLEAANIEAEASGINDGEYQLMKNDYPNLARGKYSEWSTTESSDDVEKQELEEASDEEETHFFDTNEYFAEPTSGSGSIDVDCMRLENQTDNMHKADAYEHGKAGNSLMRILYVAAFAVSGYASSEGRHCKPFNPLLGETYEADFPEKGIRFFSEKVKTSSAIFHMLMLAVVMKITNKVRKGIKLKLKPNISGDELEPEIFKDLLDHQPNIFLKLDSFAAVVTTSIYNLILGNIYCDHHGTMHIQGNRQYSCKLKFKEQSILERNPHQVHGFVEDVTGKKVAQLFGKWDDSMYFVNGEGTGNVKDRSEASLLWKKNKPSSNPTRYNLTSFAITMNELTPGLKEKLPPTDSRLRPDQRHLENGEFDKANAEKLRLEMRQRMNMVGNPDGSIETVKDRSVTLADTGKPESNGIGMDALIFLVRLVKTLLIPSKVPDLRVGQRKAFRKASGIL